jgi:hypothetical protein
VIPDLTTAVQLANAFIERSLMPELRSEFLITEARLCGMSLAGVAEKLDTAVEDLVAENAELLGLIEQAAAVGVEVPFGDDALKATSLRISQLRDTNHRLRAALITVHAQLEERGLAAGLRRAIWQAMFAAVRRGAFRGNPFLA